MSQKIEIYKRKPLLFADICDKITTRRVRMAKPIVAVVGRPNVGKSTFFNKIVGKRISIVDDAPGVTRDRIYADAEWCGKKFTLIDTGGLDPKSDDVFQKVIEEQANIAMEMADVIVMLVDAKTGIALADEILAKKLRNTNKPVILIVNKLDKFNVEDTYEFYQLGLGEPYPLSCEQSKGIGDVLDVITSYFKDISDDDDKNGLKIAVVGRPNVGKSSIINRMLGEKRVVVSNVEGTTRDSVFIPFKYNRKMYQLVDTAGLRRSRSVENVSVEGYSVLRTMSAIEKADVVLIVFDGSQPLTEQDVRIAGYVHEAGKPSVVVVNKVDIMETKKEQVKEKLMDELSYMDYLQAVFISAKEGTRLGDIMPAVLKVYENASKRITTGLLNDVLQDAILNFEPPARNGKKVKLSYITQAETNPPTFVIFANDAKLINFSYERYLENKFREKIDFSGTPIKIIFKSREEK